jgi:predicted nucleotidyltransferase
VFDLSQGARHAKASRVELLDVGATSGLLGRRATLPTMEPDLDTLVECVRRALTGIAGIRVAYLFGSRVTRRARIDSDLDLAVRYDSSLDPAERSRVELDLVAALTDELGRLGERADVVDLDRASSAVGFRAIRDGRRVIERDPAERVRLEARIARMYDDDAPRRELIRRAAVQAGHRLGAQVTGRS